MTDETQLDAWLNRVATELGCSAEGIDLQDLLDVARDVAHNQIRPGAPTSTFYIGYALGLWEQRMIAAGVTPTSDQRGEQLHVFCREIQRLATGR